MLNYKMSSAVAEGSTPARWRVSRAALAAFSPLWRFELGLMVVWFNIKLTLLWEWSGNLCVGAVA
jgi:hypothetical protein